MTTREFLERLRASDIKVWADGERLRCNAPQGLLTPELQAELARRKPEILDFLRAGSANRSSLVPIQPNGSRLPFFAVPGHNGDVLCYVRLARHLGDDQPFYALQPPGYDGEREPLRSVTGLAAHYADEMRRFLPCGPYVLGGYCAGGAIAFEVAQQLRARGERVELLALFGTPFPTVYLLRHRLLMMCRYVLHRIPFHLRAVGNKDLRKSLSYLRDRMSGFTREAVSATRESLAADDEGSAKAIVGRATLAAVRDYRPKMYPGRIDLFVASGLSLARDYGQQRRWRAVAGGGLQVHVGPDGCTGTTMLREDYARDFAGRLRECLDRLGDRERGGVGAGVAGGKSPPAGT